MDYLYILGILFGLYLIFWPIWRFIFAVKIPYRGNKYVVTGIAGGSSKTTLAEALVNSPQDVYGQMHDTKLHHVRIDDCKYKPDWSRFTKEEFKHNVWREILNEGHNRWVVDGLFSDYFTKDPEGTQLDLMKQLCESADYVIRIDLPFIVTIWRKAFRSFKRRFGCAKQGAGKESWHNVKMMIKNTFIRYDFYKGTLDKEWKKLREKQTETRYIHIKWPYYPVVKK